MAEHEHNVAFQHHWSCRGRIRNPSTGQMMCLRQPCFASNRHNMRMPLSSRRRILSISASAENGVEGDDAQDDNPLHERQIDSRSAAIDPASTKTRLLGVLNELINDDSQITAVERLIYQLESLRATPITDVFTELGLAGEWRLLFSSMRTRAQGNVRIRQIGQVFDTDNKLMTNKVHWSFPSKSGSEDVFADLTVVCTYKFVGPGRLEIGLKEHKVTIEARDDGKKNDMPDDLQAVIRQLQLALPMDFFDPSGLLDVSYMEPDFRLARFLGKRLAGVRNVFIRRDSS